jgi:hypothetical protein
MRPTARAAAALLVVLASCGGGSASGGGSSGSVKVSVACEAAVANYESTIASDNSTDAADKSSLSDSLNACRSRDEWAKADEAHAPAGGLPPKDYLDQTCSGSDASTQTCMH